MRRALFVSFTVLILSSTAVFSQPLPSPGALTLWYSRPAPQWDHAMPVGNGRLGAMVFGAVNRERIQLNEESLWMPSGDPLERDNPEALKHLPEVRRLLFAGAPSEAYRLAEKYLVGRPSRLQSYQTLGDLRLTFEHDGQSADYRRELDLDAAIARVSYRVGEVRYTREVFASHPDQAVVVRLAADRPGAITLNVWMDRPQDARTTTIGDDRLDMVGCLACGKGPSFQASVKVLPAGGRVEGFPERIFVERADAVTIVLAAATSFRGVQPKAQVDRQLAAAAAKPFDRLRAAHVADHQQLFRRVSLRLGLGAAELSPLGRRSAEREGGGARGPGDQGAGGSGGQGPTAEEVQDLMWRNVGLFRERDGLAEALAILEDAWSADAARLLEGRTQDAAGWGRTSVLTVATLIARAALRREESRGGHYRTDFPKRDDVHWQRRVAETRKRHG